MKDTDISPAGGATNASAPLLVDYLNLKVNQGES
jgi:hypothetical protein